MTNRFPTVSSSLKIANSLLPKALVLALLFTTGCVKAYTLRMSKVYEPKDTSSISPKLKEKKYARVMIMPPSGTKRGEFDSKIAMFEKEFIKNGITPINGAVTGRVVMELQGDDSQKKGEKAQDLSDVERALIMAKKTGADSLLQIGDFGWDGTLYTTRYFIADPSDRTNKFNEVPKNEYDNWQGWKRAYLSSWFKFIGRLTDVSSGEVMASFQVESAANWNLPTEYMCTIKKNLYVLWENYPYETGWWDYQTGVYNTALGNWRAQAEERTIERVIAQVAKNILGQ